MPSSAFLVALLALAVGTTIGFFVQHVSVSIRYDDKWDEVPGWKKRALAATGSISAFTVGLWVLQGAPNFNPDEVIVKMWLYQTGAAYGGGTVMDLIWGRIKKGGS